MREYTLDAQMFVLGTSISLLEPPLGLMSWICLCHAVRLMMLWIQFLIPFGLVLVLVRCPSFSRNKILQKPSHGTSQLVTGIYSSFSSLRMDLGSEA